MGHMRRIIVVCVAAATALSALGIVAGRSGSEALAVSRVEATPVPTPTPTPPQEPERIGTGLVANHCPQLDGAGESPMVVTGASGPVPMDGAVEIPSLGVDAPLVRVGVRDGEMVVPRTAHEVAWLDTGSFPGPTNNAVLAGHHDWSGRLGSFFRLAELRQGQEVVVRFEGRDRTFRVAWVCSFDLDTPEAPRIMGPTDVPSVTLITCGGIFDRRAGTHNQRIVVRAELVEPPQAA